MNDPRHNSSILPPSETAGKQSEPDAPADSSQVLSETGPAVSPQDELIRGTPDPIPEELRDVAPLLYGFEFTEDDFAVWERQHDLPAETCMMKRYARKLGAFTAPLRELGIHGFFHRKVTELPAGGFKELIIIYFAKKEADGYIETAGCPSAELVKLYGEALYLSRPVRWIPV